jgi:hypothetical protein
MINTIFTNCGKLGDMFLCLPVISWYYKKYDKPVIFALSRNFPYSTDAYQLLMMQECIADVIYFDYNESMCENRTSDMLGKYHVQYEMLPEPYNNKSYNLYPLGFHRWPDKYLPELYAEEYGFGVDRDFVLEYGNKNLFYKDDKVKVDRYEKPMLDHFSDYIRLPQSNSIIENLQYAAGANEILTFTTGFSIMATLARIPITIYGDTNLIQHHNNYYDINGGINWLHY